MFEKSVGENRGHDRNSSQDRQKISSASLGQQTYRVDLQRALGTVILKVQAPVLPSVAISSREDFLSLQAALLKVIGTIFRDPRIKFDDKTKINCSDPKFTHASNALLSAALGSDLILDLNSRLVRNVMRNPGIDGELKREMLAVESKQLRNIALKAFLTQESDPKSKIISIRNAAHFSDSQLFAIVKQDGYSGGIAAGFLLERHRNNMQLRRRLEPNLPVNYPNEAKDVEGSICNDRAEMNPYSQGLVDSGFAVALALTLEAIAKSATAKTLRNPITTVETLYTGFAQWFFGDRFFRNTIRNLLRGPETIEERTMKSLDRFLGSHWAFGTMHPDIHRYILPKAFAALDTLDPRKASRYRPLLEAHYS